MKITYKAMPKNIPLLIKERANTDSDTYLQAYRGGGTAFQYRTYAVCYDTVIKLALALKNIPIKRADNIAFISDNRFEWLMIDLAILSLGARDVPRGCDSMAHEVRFIIDFSDCAVAIFENEKQLQKVLDNIAEVPKLKTVILIDKISDVAMDAVKKTGLTIHFYEDLLKTGDEIYSADPSGAKLSIESEMEETKATDIATIIFTSGTTGTPKGVMIRHESFMVQLSVIHNFVACKRGEYWMTILPVWHSFERFIQYVAIATSCTLAYSKPNAPQLLSDMAAVRPQWICGVPRLWEALYTGVMRTIKKRGGVPLTLFTFFIKVGTLYANISDYVLGNVVQFKKRSRLLDFIIGIVPFILLWPLRAAGELLVFRAIKGKFGGRIVTAISGGGALPRNIDDFYRAIGFPLLEGYGMSETAPVISFRDIHHPRAGVVGVIFPTFDLKIVENDAGSPKNMVPLGAGREGLIVLKSKQVMAGYYNRPDLTAAVIDKDGYLNTGDLGMLTLDNELKITGRAKDTIVLSDGENIEPVLLENALTASPYIESVVIVGQDKKYLTALIVPARDMITAYAQEAGLAEGDYNQLLNLPQVRALYDNIVNDATSSKNGFRLCEKVYRYTLLSKSFEAGVELSAKLEVMRYKIATLYKKEIAAMYQ